MSHPDTPQPGLAETLFGHAPLRAAARQAVAWGRDFGLVPNGEYTLVPEEMMIKGRPVYQMRAVFFLNDVTVCYVGTNLEKGIRDPRPYFSTVNHTTVVPLAEAGQSFQFTVARMPEIGDSTEDYGYFISGEISNAQGQPLTGFAIRNLSPLIPNLFVSTYNVIFANYQLVDYKRTLPVHEEYQDPNWPSMCVSPEAVASLDHIKVMNVQRAMLTGTWHLPQSLGAEELVAEVSRQILSI